MSDPRDIPELPPGYEWADPPGSALPPVSPHELKSITQELAWAFQKWHDAWSGTMDHVGPSVIADIVRHAFESGRAGPPGEPSYEAQRAAFRILWGRDPEHVSAGDGEGETICARDEDPWIEIYEMLRAAYAVDGRGTATP